MEEETKMSAADEDESSNPKMVEKTDPPFIHYLLTKKHSCVFLVGYQAEEIGVHKDNLMAHSEVFRRMLENSPLAEKGNIPLPDIQTDTFKNLLRFVYGNNIVSTLTMEDAMDLMYVAEKYMVEELKPELFTHISSMLTVENVCIPLKRPECYTQESLKDTIDKTVQDFTDRVMKQQNFLDLNTFGIVNILKLDPLAVTEIELWRGVIKWARHNAKNEGSLPLRELFFGSLPLRELLSEPLQHIRFCTMDIQDFGKEVILTEVLSHYEVSKICKSIFSKEMFDNLTSVCNTIQTRNITLERSVDAIEFGLQYCCSSGGTNHSSTVTIVTNQYPITMLAAWFECKPHSKLGDTHNLQFQCECDVVVTCIDYASNIGPTRVVEFKFEEKIDYGKAFQIQLLENNKFIQLSRYSEYTFSFCFKKFAYTSLVCFSKSGIDFDPVYFKEIKSNHAYQNSDGVWKNLSCSLAEQMTYAMPDKIN